eukprot:TRINITY_DN3480_c0_g1_i1.p1 TRINITY_DN3480_c0_g1~~TRINITY_DN3480_c0_g1_i1.p1  ORF type:complete len:687 (-),score=122.12 TRINITY_DN3480_c0_g1_i1:419-2479(-)
MPHPGGRDPPASGGSQEQEALKASAAPDSGSQAAEDTIGPVGPSAALRAFLPIPPPSQQVLREASADSLQSAGDLLLSPTALGDGDSSVLILPVEEQPDAVTVQVNEDDERRRDKVNDPPPDVEGGIAAGGTDSRRLPNLLKRQNLGEAAGKAAADASTGVADERPPVANANLADASPWTVRSESSITKLEPAAAWKLNVTLCIVAMLEGADVAVLGPTLYALQKSLDLSLTDLAYLMMAQAICKNLAAPLWGILADWGMVKRSRILVIGALGQGIVTIALACVSEIQPMIFLRALNGCMLASLRPISNGIAADTTEDLKRGAAFGRLQAAIIFGMLVSTAFTGPTANKMIFGIDGWRIAFLAIGLFAFLVAALVWCFSFEPRKGVEAKKPSAERTVCRIICDEFNQLCTFLRIPTFLILILQGTFGTIPWTVMGNMMLFFKLSGLSDEAATLLSTAQIVAVMIGSLVGGYVADSLATKFSFHGRPLSAQITVTCGIPLAYSLYWGVPPGQGTIGVYAVLIGAFGLLASWAQSGTNFPVLAEIVPLGSRTKAMAWEMALENTFANAVGPPIVAFLATLYGYDFGSQSEAAERGADVDSAKALGKATATCIILPWLLCLAAYSCLHWTYPEDVRRQQKAVLQAKKTKQLEKRLENPRRGLSRGSRSFSASSELGGAGAEARLAGASS